MSVVACLVYVLLIMPVALFAYSIGVSLNGAHHRPALARLLVRWHYVIGALWPVSLPLIYVAAIMLLSKLVRDRLAAESI